MGGQREREQAGEVSQREGTASKQSSSRAARPAGKGVHCAGRSDGRTGGREREREQEQEQEQQQEFLLVAGAARNLFCIGQLN